MYHSADHAAPVKGRFSFFFDIQCSEYLLQFFPGFDRPADIKFFIKILLKSQMNDRYY